MIRRQMTEDRIQLAGGSGQLAASQMVNLSTSQIVMNGVNNKLKIFPFDQSTI